MAVDWKIEEFVVWFNFHSLGFLHLTFGLLQWELVAPDLASVFGLLRSNLISTTCRVLVSVTLWFSFVDGGFFLFFFCFFFVFLLSLLELGCCCLCF